MTWARYVFSVWLTFSVPSSNKKSVNCLKVGCISASWKDVTVVRHATGQPEHTGTGECKQVPDSRCPVDRPARAVYFAALPLNGGPYVSIIPYRSRLLGC